LLTRPKDAETVKKIKAAQKQLVRALANLERAANHLEEAGLTPQAYILDEAGESVEELSEILAAL
jgi:hypothetical protein